MFASRNLQRKLLKTISYLIHTNSSKSSTLLSDVSPKIVSSNVIQWRFPCEDHYWRPFNCLNGSRAMSTERGRSMRSKVERRMQKESGKTLREVRRAKKLRKKLMTDEERLIYNLRRAKKKVALLLQKLKKYELPDLPPPRHDPELLTLEQLQAFKKIGFRNKNYVPVGVRGVFGGVVQNMHLHWKFHETVQVCCDNFPKEKIKEMATMIARLSGGIVINVHNVKTIIMFRGRNYRQPKNLIPVNTLTKRKALFKARFEQALESQKLNIKKFEQQLRRMGVNPEDPVAMASIHRVASTFFNAIDKKEGSPYVFHGDKQSVAEPNNNLEQSEPHDDSDQEELDRFIADIEDAADQEWEAEEAAEKEELSQMRYWNREDFAGRFRRPEMHRNEDSDNENRGARDWKDGRDSHNENRGARDWKDGRESHNENRGGRNWVDRRDSNNESRGRNWNDRRGPQRTMGSDDEENDISEGDDEWDSNDVEDVSDLEKDAGDFDKSHGNFERSRTQRGKQDNKIGRASKNEGFKRNAAVIDRGQKTEEDSGSEDLLSDLEGAMWESDAEEEHVSKASKVRNDNYRSSSDEEEDFSHMKKKNMLRQDQARRVQESDGDDSDETDDEFNSRIAKRSSSDEEEDFPHMKKKNMLRQDQARRVQESDGDDSDETDDEFNSRIAKRSSSDEEEDFPHMKKKNMLRQDQARRVQESDGDDSDETDDEFNSRIAKRKQNGIGKSINHEGFKKYNADTNSKRSVSKEDSGSEGMFSDSEIPMWESDDEDEDAVTPLKAASYDYRSSSDEEEEGNRTKKEDIEKSKKMKTPKQKDEFWDSD